MKSVAKTFAARLVRINSLWSFLNATAFKALEFMQRERQKFLSSRRQLPHQVFSDRTIEEVCPDLTVRHGFFRGLRFPHVRSVSSGLFPKLLGSYEREVHPVLEKICRRNYAEIVNIGCAEGYYAVGLAMRLPGAKIFAFDTNEEAKNFCREMAELNGVSDRVILGSFCDPQVLRSLPLRGRALIVSDCEGYEKALFTPEIVERLAPHDVFIEVHDGVEIDISSLMRKRFAKTHAIESILSVDDVQKLKTYDYPELEHYDLASRHDLLTEYRPHVMEWLFLQAKNPRPTRKCPRPHLLSERNQSVLLMERASDPKVIMLTAGAWYLREAAAGLQERGRLAGLWISDKNTSAIRADLFRRCWPFHLAMKPFYRAAPQLMTERMFYRFFPIWKAWLKSQRTPPFNVMHAIVGYATEAFAIADRHSALKVVDLPNSHPTSYCGYWQRECDLWCPGHVVPIPRWMFARMNREIAEADLVIVQSDFCRDSVVANGVAAEKVFVNPMGVNRSVFSKRSEVPVKPRFVAVGTICVRKGHQYLFRAFELLKKNLPEAELVCVGDYKADFALEKTRWHGTFTHHSHLSHPELADLLQTCTAFVFPSREEGIARAQMEALACGLPVIGTYEGGATTVVKDGIEGFIVEGNSPLQIAEAMQRIALDRELNQRMGEAAYLRGSEGNSWSDYSDRLLGAYAEASRRRNLASTCA